MTYKPRTAEIVIKNTGTVDFVDELKLQIPNRIFIKKMNIPLNQTITTKINYDEVFVPLREYPVKATIIYQDKTIDTKTINVVKKPSKKIFDFFVRRIRHGLRRGRIWDVTNDKFFFKYAKKGTSKYLDVYYFDTYLLLEPGFNYEIDVKVIQQNSFCYKGECYCVSYPNKTTKAFVRICGPQDHIWDYVYNDKAYSEVRLYLGKSMFYNTIMTGAYKRGIRYISDTAAIDTFKLYLEQKDEKTYSWKITNFRRTTSKPNRVVLTNVNYIKNTGTFGLLAILGEDATKRIFNIPITIPLRVETYVRVGRAADITYSSHPYSRAEVYIHVKKVY